VAQSWIFRREKSVGDEIREKVAEEPIIPGRLVVVSLRVRGSD
jgi:hypothetical protein